VEKYLKGRWGHIKYRRIGILQGFDRALMVSAGAILFAAVVWIGVRDPLILAKIWLGAALYMINPAVGSVHAVLAMCGLTGAWW
jgi:hypothetical protein